MGDVNDTATFDVSMYDNIIAAYYVINSVTIYRNGDGWDMNTSYNPPCITYNSANKTVTCGNFTWNTYVYQGNGHCMTFYASVYIVVR